MRFGHPVKLPDLSYLYLHPNIFAGRNLQRQSNAQYSGIGVELVILPIAHLARVSCTDLPFPTSSVHHAPQQSLFQPAVLATSSHSDPDATSITRNPPRCHPRHAQRTTTAALHTTASLRPRLYAQDCGRLSRALGGLLRTAEGASRWRSAPCMPHDVEGSLHRGLRR